MRPVIGLVEDVRATLEVWANTDKGLKERPLFIRRLPPLEGVGPRGMGGYPPGHVGTQRVV